MSDVTGEMQAQPEPKGTRQRPARALSRWLAPIALLIAVVAVALASWALISASSDAPAAAQEAADPKMHVCTTFDTVTKAVARQTHANLGPDPVALKTVAGNARLAFVGGAQQLLNSLDAATPPELADPVRSFANGLQAIGIHTLAEVPDTDPEQIARLAQVNTTRKQIVDLCQ